MRRRMKYCLFCTELISGISSCIAGPRKSVDSRRVKSYQLFYEKRISDLKSCWDAFHVVLHLTQPDPVWTQTDNRLLFNQMLVAAIQHDGKRKGRLHVPSLSGHQQLGADEENVIRYMAGYCLCLFPET